MASNTFALRAAKALETGKNLEILVFSLSIFLSNNVVKNVSCLECDEKYLA